MNEKTVLRLTQWLILTMIVLALAVVCIQTINAVICKVLIFALTVCIVFTLILTYCFNKCPECGHVIQVRNMNQKQVCANCGHEIDLTK